MIGGMASQKKMQKKETGGDTTLKLPQQLGVTSWILTVSVQSQLIFYW